MSNDELFEVAPKKTKDVTCVHHNDLDGHCSAAIVKRFYEGLNVKFIEMSYEKVFPLHEVIVDSVVVIVDFSVSPDVMRELQILADRVIWIDHHATAKDYPYQNLPGLRNFEDKEFAGCELAWMYFFPTRSIPMAVELIGDYDKWALKLQESTAFYEGMKMQNTSPENYALWSELLDNGYYSLARSIENSGRTAISYRDNYCSSLCNKHGYETSISGIQAYACNMAMFGSNGFGDRMKKYPLCISYIHNGSSYVVSLYSESIDVSVIAKKFGGGGHSGASGFVCEALPWNK